MNITSNTCSSLETLGFEGCCDCCDHTPGQRAPAPHAQGITPTYGRRVGGVR